MLGKMAVSSIAILLFFSISGYSQTVDEIINKNIEAHGGLERLKQIKSVRMTGKLTSPQGVENPIVYMKKRPNFLRVELTVQGMTGIQAYDGQTAWYIIPFGGGTKDPQKLTGNESLDIIEQADFDGPLVDYKQKGNTVELMGKEVSEGAAAYKLKITSQNGNVRYLYLDENTGLETKASRIIKQGGGELSIDSFFGDYRTIDGMVYAFSIVIKSEAQPGPRYSIDKVEHNVDLEDSLFRMPVSQTTE